MDTDVLSEILEPLFLCYSIVAPKFEPGVYLFRGRLLSSKPERLNELHHPPKGVAPIGRANGPGESIFYGATIRNVPFFEIGAATNDTVALSCWKTTAPMLLNHVGFLSGAENFIDAARALDTSYHFTIDTRQISELNRRIHDYLARKFCQKVDCPDLYKLTNAISRRLLQTPFDGLMYPTIQMRGNADNVLLTSTFAESSLEFVSVEFVRVRSQAEFSFQVDVIDSATIYDSNGYLKWSGRPLNWVIRTSGGELTMVPRPDGHSGWVALDEFGHRVDPE